MSLAQRVGAGEDKHVKGHIFDVDVELRACSGICRMSYPSLENRMDTTDKFLRFAAECEAMAKISPSRENKVLWNSLAQRWLRCAQLTEKLDSDLQSFGMRRRQARNAAEYRSPTERRIRHKARNTAEIAVSS